MNHSYTIKFIIGVAIPLFLTIPVFAQIEINDIDELQLIGNDSGYPLDGNYVLGNNIDASATAGWNSGAGFTPIGAWVPAFSGTFDGQNYTITGLTIIRSTTSGVGLFVGLDGATIQNIHLENATISGQTYVGILACACTNGCTLTNCSVAGNITCTGVVGGLVGELGNSSMTQCRSRAVINATGNSVGSLVGIVPSTSAAFTTAVTGCFATGSVTGLDYVGGLIGSVNGNASEILITNCFASGSATGEEYVGGLIGYINAYSSNVTMANCYSAGLVTGTSPTGGLLGSYGQNTGIVTITNTYWDMYTSLQLTSAKEGLGASERKTTDEMMEQATFVNWDFTSVWGIYEGVTYPFLQAVNTEFFPVGVTIDQATAQEDPTNTLPICFDVVFDEPITSFAANQLNISGTATGVVASLNGAGSNYTVWINSIDSDGTIIISIPSNACNALSNSMPNDNSMSTDNMVTYNGATQMPVAMWPAAILLLAAGIGVIRQRKR